jgi:hypothetical protein
MAWLLTIINLLLLAFLGWRGLKLLKEIRNQMSTQETQLQESLGILRDVVAPGVTEILTRLDAVPTDNPAVQDEIDGVRAVAQEMADKINAKLNPPVPDEGGGEVV